jgi:hypothetical protein
MTIKRFSFLCGAALQGLLLGTGLFLAIVELVSSQIGTQIFRYQGF